MVKKNGRVLCHFGGFVPFWRFGHLIILRAVKLVPPEERETPVDILEVRREEERGGIDGQSHVRIGADVDSGKQKCFCQSVCGLSLFPRALGNLQKQPQFERKKNDIHTCSHDFSSNRATVVSYATLKNS